MPDAGAAHLAMLSVEIDAQGAHAWSSVTANELTHIWDISPTTKFSIQLKQAAINTAEINGHIHLQTRNSLSL